MHTVCDAAAPSDLTRLRIKLINARAHSDLSRSAVNPCTYVVRLDRSRDTYTSP